MFVLLHSTRNTIGNYDCVYMRRVNSKYEEVRVR